MQEYTNPNTRIFLFSPEWKDIEYESINMNATVSSLEYSTITNTYEIPSNKYVCICNIGTLYPYPPIYHKIPRKNLLTYGKQYSETMIKFTVSTAMECLHTYINHQNKHNHNTTTNSNIITVADIPNLANKLCTLYTSIQSLATQELPSDQLYPIHRAAGILFSDGSTIVCREDKCLEYGCTRDAIVGLSNMLVTHTATKSIYPLVIIQTDQFGICTSPAAAPRAWLHEYGYDNMIIPIHTLPTDNNDNSKKHPLIITTIAALSPASPAINLSAATVHK